jgi:hypothetical protein
MTFDLITLRGPRVRYVPHGGVLENGRPLTLGNLGSGSGLDGFAATVPTFVNDPAEPWPPHTEWVCIRCGNTVRPNVHVDPSEALAVTFGADPDAQHPDRDEWAHA